MTGNASHRADEPEQQIASAIRDLGSSQDEVRRLIAALPPGQPLVMCETWAALARDDSLDAWRRLEACKLLLNRCIPYPCSLEAFVSAAITPLGIAQSQIVDMTKAQSVPLARQAGSPIRMAPLPIVTAVGPAAVYFALRDDARTVEQVAVYPETVETDTR